MADAAVQMGCELGKWLVTEGLWPRIKCHLDYWRCFRDNVQGLRDEIGLLDREKRNMDQKIEEARLRAESATTDVQDWSKDFDQKLAEAERILQGCDGVKAWNMISRYSWGKRAKKTAERIAQLRNGANAIRISDPAPPPAMGPVPHKPTMEFESRKRVEEDIMEFLRDDHTCMIAICGAGGIGKTTMVHRIEDLVRRENLFDEVVCVVVSQQIDLLKNQKEIAELLGLKFSEDTLAARAHKLRIRLQDSKRKLIIFDDVWESFKLEDIGVPFENGFTKCKIILTSRITDACNKMGAKIIRMELLKKEEAWTLFKEKAGSSVERPDLRPIAENVVAECKGMQGLKVLSKKMGELDAKPFYCAAKRKYSDEEALEKAAEICSLWEDYLRDPGWHPYKVISVGGKHKEILDEDDEKLKELKNDMGDEIYEAVTVALNEMNEYNPSGRYPVPKLWNTEEKRKGSLAEGIQHLLKQWKLFRTKNRRN